MQPHQCLWAWFITDIWLLDWATAGVLILINHLVPVHSIEPAHRPYNPQDLTLAYPLNDGTISSSVLYALVFAFPTIVFASVATAQRSTADLHHALLSLVEAFALASGWKRWMNLVGRLRPSWLARVATGDGRDVADGRLAYPSGHSAYMFFSATVLTMWGMGKLRLLAHSSQALFPKLLLCLAPLVLATYVSCTRLVDYEHDFADVNAGCFIGICSGLLAYSLQYPSPWDPCCHLPKLRRRVSPLSCQLAPREGVMELALASGRELSSQQT